MAYAEFTGELDAPEKGFVPFDGELDKEPGGFVASAKQSIGAVIRGAGQAAADFIPGVSQDNPVKRYGQEVIEANPTAVNSFADIANKPGTAVAEATGNAASSIGGPLAARALGMGITAAAPLTGPAAPVTAAIGQVIAWLGPPAIAALPSFGSIRDKQMLSDPEMEDSAKAKAIAALGAGTVGLIESKFGPQQWAMAALTREGRAQLAKKFAETGILKGLGYGAAKGAAVEGAEELVQNPVEQAASFQDPTTPQNLKETAFGGAMGAIGGGVLGGGTGVAVNLMPQKTAQDILAAPDIDSAIQTATEVLALPAPGANPGETILATERGTAGTAGQFDMLRRQAEIREAGGGMGRNADITDVQAKPTAIPNDPAALLDRQTGDPLAPMLEDRRIRTEAIDTAQQEAEQRRVAELEAIPEIATEQNAVQAAVSRAGALEAPTAMELALQRARGPSAPAAAPVEAAVDTPPLPRIVERTPEMVALPQKLAEQRAAADSSLEVVRIQNQSGKFAFTVIPKAADVSNAVEAPGAVPSGVDGRGADVGGGEPAGGLGDGGRGAAAEPGRSGAADVAVGRGAGQPAAVEPQATWFGRRGDGYLTEGDAQMAIPSRQRVNPDLRWAVERMPSGKFRLAGYASAAVKSQDASAQTQAPQAAATAPVAEAVPSDAGTQPAAASAARSVPAQVTQTPPPSGVAVSAPAAAPTERERINTMVRKSQQRRDNLTPNPFKTFLIRNGLALRLAREFAPGTRERLAMGRTFRNGGLELDALAERAAEQGYIRDRMDTDELYALITKVASGERVAPMYGQDAEAEMAAIVDRQRALEEDAAEAVAALPDETRDVLDDVPWDEPSNVGPAEAMRALGFSEQEIRDATATGQDRAQEAGAGDRRAVEAAGGQAQADSGQGPGPAREEGLTAPTPADVIAQQDQREAEQQRRDEGGDKPAPVRSPTRDQIDLLNPQGGIFDAPQFSLRDQQEDASIPYEEVEQIVDELTAKWQNRPDIRVLDSMSEAPPVVLKQYLAQRSQGTHSRVHGFHLKGTVYIVADEMTSRELVQEVLFHEALGHHGLRGWLGDMLRPMLADVILGQREKVIAKAKAYGLDMNKQADRLMAAEEVLAELAQVRPELGVIRRLVAAIRTWLRDNVPAFAKMKMTDDELIRKFIIPARGFVERGQSPRPTFTIMGDEGPETVFSIGGKNEPMASRKDVVGNNEGGRSADDNKPGAVPRTGEPVTLYYNRNTESSKGMAPAGMDFGQKIEPTGEYMNVERSFELKAPTEKWEAGRITFKNPLVLEHKSTDSNGWKRDLSRMFGGKTGARLSDAIKQAGHDGILTYDKDGLSEAVNLNGEKTANESTAPDSDGAQFSLGDNPSVTDSAAFRKWFGKSRVVDSEGKPLVVYHGTDEDFSEFKPGSDGGIHFGTSEQAAKAVGSDTPSARILPVYLSIKNPLRVEDFGTRDWEWGKAIKRAKAAGHDGLVYANEWEGGGDSYVAFRPNQIKSAIGNNGNFDPEDNRVQFSLRSAVTNKVLPKTWQAPDESKLDDFIYTVQDKHIDTKRAVQAVRDAIGAIADEQDPYLQEELFHGRAAMATKEFLEKQLRPLLVEMQARGVEMSDFEEYLHNRHAERRNVQVAKVNPKMQDGGSGIKTADARAYLAGLPAAKRKAYEALAKRVEGINRDTRKLLVSSGLEKQTTIDAWEAAYGDEYVPLMREEMDDGTTGIGQGYSVRGSASKRAMGSDKPVANIIANIALQRERTITRAEKKRIGEALYGLVLKAPNDEFWFAIDPQLSPSNVMATQMQLIAMGLDPADAESIAQEPKSRYVDKATGLVTERINPALRGMDNVLAVRIDGEDKFVFFNKEDPRAMRMVTALKNLDADQLGTVMGTVAKMTRWFASVNTQFNPVFGVTNITRDVQTALLNLSSTPLKNHRADVLKHTLSALRGIYIDLRDHRAGKQPSSVWAGLFEEFQREGGATGYRDMYANAQERADQIASELRAVNDGAAMKLGKGIMGWLSDYNETMENSVRLAAYKVGKEQGLSNQQAASLAKNLTVNFNRKGQVALQVGALYAFFNASTQGMARMGQTMFEGGKLSATGRKILAGGLLLGSMQALLLAAAGYDDDEPPDFVRERALVVPVGGGKYVAIPMPLGFHVIPNLGRIPTEWAMGGFKNTTKYLAQIVDVVSDAFNPIGSAGLSLQTIAPTVIDPLAALSENRDWTGKPIAKKDFDANRPTAGHTRAKDTATPWAKMISYGINIATGGTDYKPGMASPTPDQIDYLIGQVTGGVGRELSKAAQVVESGFSGEELPMHKIPLVGRFVGTTEGQAAEAARFYDNLREIGAHKVEIDGLRRDKRGAEVAGYIRENKEARLIEMATSVQRQVSEMQKRKRELIKNGASRERIKLMDQQITARMRALNLRVQKLEEQGN